MYSSILTTFPWRAMDILYVLCSSRALLCVPVNTILCLLSCDSIFKSFSSESAHSAVDVIFGAVQTKFSLMMISG